MSPEDRDHGVEALSEEKPPEIPGSHTSSEVDYTKLFESVKPDPRFEFMRQSWHLRREALEPESSDTVGENIRFFFRNGLRDQHGRDWWFYTKVILLLLVMLLLGLLGEFYVDLPWYV